MRKFLKWLVWALCLIWVPLVILLALSATAPLWQREWVTRVPGVRTEAKYPFRSPTDFGPGSPFDLLSRAVAIISEKPDTARDEATQLFSKPWTDSDFPILSAELDRNRKAMDLIRSMPETVGQEVPSYAPGVGLHPLTMTLRINNLFRASAARKFEAHDPAGAYAELMVSIDLGDRLSRGTPLIHRLMEMACEVPALREMRIAALQHDVPALVARSAIHRLCEVDASMEPLAEAYRQEAQATPAMVAYYYKTDPVAPVWAEFYGESRWQHWASCSLGYLFGSSPAQTATNLTAEWSRFIRIAEQPYDPVSLSGMETPQQSLGFLETFKMRDPVGYRMTHISPRLFRRAEINCRHYERLVALRATEVVLALRQFQQAEYRVPGRLDELVPTYLPAVPIDPFDLNPIRYVANPGNSWLIYSVGPNQKDEGGVATKKPPRDYNDPGDLIYSSSEAARP